MDRYSDSSSSDTASSGSRCPSPDKQWQGPAATSALGISPNDLVGRVIKRVHCSAGHPVLTFDFDDNSTFQVLVDGYDPRNPGIRKHLDVDQVFTSGQIHNLTVTDCQLVTLSDKAFQRSSVARDDSWWKDHRAFAIKVSEDNPRWHTVWARLQEEDNGECVFRSYGDVYIDRLQRSPKKMKFPRRA